MLLHTVSPHRIAEYAQEELPVNEEAQVQKAGARKWELILKSKAGLKKCIRAAVPDVLERDIPQA